ncbi:septation protein SepH [Kribbella sp. NBC_01245]|uniref:septation protein SepH n=1 Tax=Kribbella sp. NBC_01245 TaxID=2903578 RepID=UPI002E2CBE19|nr:septation protein SepH [Kribbella sp. NBC_01245]
MREAKLVGLSPDGKQLILAAAETGEEFAVPVDDRLRAALRGDRARLGQLEIQMESALRPRDIQARIRAGESPEAVAAVAQMPMERVMAFAGPVLAERDHVANLAQRASVRRRGGEGPTRNLGAWVTERLRGRAVDPASADWDAWRRDDGRWAVRVSYQAEDIEHVAMFAYDAPGRYAVPDDEEARWLVGEQTQVIAPQQPERRLTAVVNTIDIAPDHMADSYEAGFEAGFEDAISITRERPANPANRDESRDQRGPRRFQSVPSTAEGSPDEEPTLINVGPVDPPSPIRGTVRTVERSPEPPVEVPVNPPAERRPEAPAAEAPAAPVEAPAPAAPATPAAPAAETNVARLAPARNAETADVQARETARSESFPQAAPERGNRVERPEPLDALPFEPAAPEIPTRPSAPTAPAPQAPKADEPDAKGEVAQETPAPEPKKKPARRGSKRASVPSWDEIMFGKKAD